MMDDGCWILVNDYWLWLLITGYSSLTIFVICLPPSVICPLTSKRPLSRLFPLLFLGFFL
jgi:hypothetical protein